MEWSWVDLVAGAIHIPEMSSKTGARDVPLTPPLKAILDVQDDLRNGSQFVFPSPKDVKRPADVDTFWFALLRNEAQLGRLRIHDLRHSAVSVGAGLGVAQFGLQSYAGHSNASTTAMYVHAVEGRSAAHVAADAIAGELENMIQAGRKIQKIG